MVVAVGGGSVVCGWDASVGDWSAKKNRTVMTELHFWVKPTTIDILLS